jgi:hypothetical protein
LAQDQVTHSQNPPQLTINHTGQVQPTTEVQVQAHLHVHTVRLQVQVTTEAAPLPAAEVTVQVLQVVVYAAVVHTLQAVQAVHIPVAAAEVHQVAEAVAHVLQVVVLPHQAAGK